MPRPPTAITLRIIDGADRGRVYHNLGCPVTIGREEGNSVQLNDERVSRYHLKIQEDHDRLVLTDLDSTNGTKVNGEDIQLKILRFGDVIMVGRSQLLFGTRDQIADRLMRLKQGDRPEDPTLDPNGSRAGPPSREDASDFILSIHQDPDRQGTLQSMEPPELPDRLTPVQAAQMCELLEHLQIRMRGVITAAVVGKDELVTLRPEPWHRLVDIQSQITELMRRLGEPR